jgi:hypothetical protein
MNFVQKIANWYRTRYRGKKVHGTSIKNILSTMHAMTGPNARPHRQPTVVVYSKLHYETRVKPKFDAEWATVKDTTPATARVALCRDFVRKCWDKETDEFKESVEREASEMHRAALEEWKGARKVPERTAETYHQ